MSHNEALFTAIAHGRKAKGMESACGEGSSLAYTEDLRERLHQLFTELDIRTLLDIPCGDFNWFQHMEPVQHYIGADVVQEFLKSNRERYPTLDWLHTDITQDRLPAVDLIFCRDLFIHFSNLDVALAIANIRQTSATWLLTTTHRETLENRDIKTGLWRGINLERMPFCFPPAIQYIPDGHRHLGLWRIADL